MVSKNTITGLGPIEASIVARLTYEKKRIVTLQDFDALFRLPQKGIRQAIYRLKKKNILTPIKRGAYIFSPLEAGPGGTGVDELLIPPLFFPRKNYYVGYSTMYNYYGFTEQLFQTVYVLNTRMNRKKIILGISYKFLKISENRMYGLETIKIRNAEVIISSRERTLIDLLYFNEPVGGINPASEVFSGVVKEKKCDIKKLVEYATRFPNITTRKRVGVLLEGLGVSDAVLKPLIRSVQKTAVSSLNGSRAGRFDKKWRVMVDDSRR